MLLLSQSNTQEVEILAKELQTFKKGKSENQGAILIGPQQVSLNIFTTASKNEGIQKFEFVPEKDQPGKFLMFLLGIYGFNAEIDKKTNQNKVFFTNDGKARNALKEFYTVFKVQKNQKPVVVGVQRCDAYIQTFPEFFNIIVQLIKETKTKKIPIYTIIHFEHEPDYALLSPDIKRFTTLIVSKTVATALVSKNQKPVPVQEEKKEKKTSITNVKTSVNRPFPPVFEEKVPITKNVERRGDEFKIDSKVSIFSDHQLSSQSTQIADPETIIKSLNILQVTLNELYDNHTKGQNPSYMLLRTLDESSDNLSLNSDKKRIQTLIELSKAIYSKYLEAMYYYGATEIARFTDKLFFIIGDKNNRAEFAREVGTSFQTLEKLNVATEFLAYAFLANKDKEVAIQIAEIYEQMGDIESKSQPYLARAYYFKAIQALKLINDPSFIRISDKATKTYKEDDLGAKYFSILS